MCAIHLLVYIYIVDDADECQRRRVDVDMGNLSAEDDSLRTGDVQMEGMHHCARPGWYLQFPTGVKREKGEKKK